MRFARITNEMPRGSVRERVPDIAQLLSPTGILKVPVVPRHSADRDAMSDFRARYRTAGSRLGDPRSAGTGALRPSEAMSEFAVR
jgi:hypothetical protein